MAEDQIELYDTVVIESTNPFLNGQNAKVIGIEGDGTYAVRFDSVNGGRFHPDKVRLFRKRIMVGDRVTVNKPNFVGKVGTVTRKEDLDFHCMIEFDGGRHVASTFSDKLITVIPNSLAPAPIQVKKRVRSPSPPVSRIIFTTL